MLRGHIACQQGGQAVHPLCNKCRDPEALRQAPPAGLRHGQQATWQHRVSTRAGSASAQDKAWTRVSTEPLLRPGYPLSQDLVMGGPDLTRRDPDPIQGTQHAYLGVPDRIRGSGLCVPRSGASLWRSSPTDYIMGYIIFSGHAAPLEPSMWWGRALFTARLEIATRALCLHTVVRGTRDSGYRQFPIGKQCQA
jgi:hypothetical protein